MKKMKMKEAEKQKLGNQRRCLPESYDQKRASIERLRLEQD